MKTAIALCLALLSPGAHAAERSGKLETSRCLSSGDPFVEDECRKEKIPGAGKACALTLRSPAISMRTNLWVRSGQLARPYEINDNETRHIVNGFTGLVRASAILHRNGQPKRMEIYENTDSSGQEYVLYRCIR